MSNPVKLVVFGALCLIWSSTWMMIKVGLEGAPPVTSAALRFIIAAAIVFSILAVRRLRLPRTARFYTLSLYLGVFQIGLPYALVYWAEQHITSGLTAILFSTMPLTVAVLARIILRDPLTFRKVVGIVICTLGTVVIFRDALSTGGGYALWGVAAALGSAFCASLSSVVMKRYAKPYHPLSSLLLPMAIGGILLLAAGRAMEAGRPVLWNGITWGSILYLAAIGSVLAFGLYYWIVKHIDVTILAYQTFIIPILACVIGWIFLGETVTIHVVIGGGMICAGIALATFRFPYPKRSDGVGYQHGP
jgi:drug/metabolite transporter (DMT)-like permease